MRAILDAAAREFSTRGLSGTRIMDIADGARVSSATFYSYFRSKEEVFVCASLEPFINFSKQFASTLDEARLTASDDLELTDFYVETLYAHLKEHEPAVRAVLLASQDPTASEATQRARRAFSRVLRDLDGVAQHWAEARGTSVPDAKQRTRAILSLVVSTVLLGDWFYGRNGKTSEAQALATVKDMVYRAYGVKAPSSAGPDAADRPKER